MNALELWTVYDRPADFPSSAVARHWLVGPDGAASSDGLLIAPSLDLLRAMLPAGMVVIPRDERDDPAIVETWL